MPGTMRTPFFVHPTIFKEQSTIAARITTDTAQTIADNTPTAVTFATPLNEDPLQLKAWQTVWNSANPGQFVTPIRGWYLVGGSVTFESLTGAAYLRILQDGVTTDEQIIEVTARLGRMSVTTLRPAVVGSVFTLEAYQQSGGPVNIRIDGHTPVFWILRAFG